MAERVEPFTLVFGAMAGERFPGLAASLGGTGRNETDRDAFVLDRAVVELLQDLVPEPHDDGQIMEFLATLHHAYLYWRAGCPRVAFDRAHAARLLSPTVAHAGASDPPTLRPSAYYQFPERLVWAQLTPDAPHEPLDGLFLRSRTVEIIEVLGIFGVHAGRPGFGVAEAVGTRPRSLTRPDGSPSFSPVLPGGDAAGLHSLVGTDELLELGFRSAGEAA
ncbi:MAG: hypothetical protein ACREL2_06905 [Gemmatimonadales bacterium]